MRTCSLGVVSLWSRNLATFKRASPHKKEGLIITSGRLSLLHSSSSFVSTKSAKVIFFTSIYYYCCCPILCACKSVRSCSSVDRLLKSLTGIVPMTLTASPRSKKKERKVKDLCGLLCQKQSKHHQHRSRLVSAKREKNQKHFSFNLYFSFSPRQRHRHRKVATTQAKLQSL